MRGRSVGSYSCLKRQQDTRQIARTACDGIPSTRIIRLSFFVPSSGSPDARDLLENLGWLRILLKAAAVALELDIVMAAGSKGPGPEERRPETRLLIGFGHARAYSTEATRPHETAVFLFRTPIMNVPFVSSGALSRRHYKLVSDVENAATMQASDQFLLAEINHIQRRARSADLSLVSTPSLVLLPLTHGPFDTEGLERKPDLTITLLFDNFGCFTDACAGFCAPSRSHGSRSGRERP